MSTSIFKGLKLFLVIFSAIFAQPGVLAGPANDVIAFPGGSIPLTSNCARSFADYGDEALKYINLDPRARFVEASTLRRSYVRAPGTSAHPDAAPFVTIRHPAKDPVSGKDLTMEIELGIASMDEPEMATAVSSLLSRSLQDAKYTHGGYLPPQVAERVQQELISPYGVKNRWGKAGHRFVMSRDAGDGKREVIGTLLVSKEEDGLFFFTSMYNNLNTGRIREQVDFNVLADGIPGHKWFDKFALPEAERYKPKGFHHIANFVIEKEGLRGAGLSRLFIDSVVENYTRFGSSPIPHSQPMLSGQGFWQIGDPPWLDRMGALGFYPRLGAETFHVDVDWARLVPTLGKDGRPIDHVNYNQSFNVPQMYEQLQLGTSPYRELYDAVVKSRQEGTSAPAGDHLLERIPEVVRLAKSGKAKFQYFQLLYPFDPAARPSIPRETKKRK